MICCYPLKTADGHWFFFHTASSTGRFAGAIAGSAQDPGENIGLPIDHIGVIIAAQGNHPDILRDRRMGRARILTIDNFMKILGIRKICRFQNMRILFGSMLKNRVKNT